MLLKASADPNHMTMVSAAGKHCLLHLIKPTFFCARLVALYTATGGGGWGHPQGAVHMAAARLVCVFRDTNF